MYLLPVVAYLGMLLQMHLPNPLEDSLTITPPPQTIPQIFQEEEVNHKIYLGILIIRICRMLIHFNNSNKNQQEVHFSRRHSQHRQDRYSLVDKRTLRIIIYQGNNSNNNKGNHSRSSSNSKHSNSKRNNNSLNLNSNQHNQPQEVYQQDR